MVKGMAHANSLYEVKDVEHSMMHFMLMTFDKKNWNSVICHFEVWVFCFKFQNRVVVSVNNSILFPVEVVF